MRFLISHFYVTSNLDRRFLIYLIRRDQVGVVIISDPSMEETFENSRLEAVGEDTVDELNIEIVAGGDND